MPAEEIRRWLNTLHPFVILVLEQTRIEVRHPELCVVDLAVAKIYRKGGSPEAPELIRFTTVALRHISRLELITP